MFTELLEFQTECLLMFKDFIDLSLLKDARPEFSSQSVVVINEQTYQSTDI